MLPTFYPHNLFCNNIFLYTLIPLNPVCACKVHLLVGSRVYNCDKTVFSDLLLQVQMLRRIHAKVSVCLGRTRDSNFLEFAGRDGVGKGTEVEMGVPVPVRTSRPSRQFHVTWAQRLHKTIDFPSAHAATVFSECRRCEVAAFVKSN